MIRRVVGSVVVAAALAVAVSTTGSARVSVTPQVQQLQRQVAWQEKHIRQLKQRRAYLHQYIKHLRATHSSGSSGGSYSGSRYISKDQAASAMRAAGFSETTIAWFNNGIISRESGYCPTAVYGYGCTTASHFYSGGPACSLFQLFHCPGPQAADPYVAARYAYDKFQHQGYSAWGG